MLKIGITGGIGSGKTTICKIFEVLGIPVFYADAAAKAVMHSDQTLVNGIKSAFGQESYVGSQLNRKHIAGIVFNDAEQLARLNALVHPAVFRAFESWVKAQQNVPYVMKEAALLFESDSYKLCDKSILVTAPQQLKVQRVMLRDAISEQEVISRMNRQLSDEQKSQMSDFSIVNDEQQLLVPQVLKLHEQFISLSRQ